MVMFEVVSLVEGEWFCYRGGLFNGEGIGHVREVASLMDREWSCYRGGEFKAERIITEVASLKEGEWCYRCGQFNRGRMVMLQRWSL